MNEPQPYSIHRQGLQLSSATSKEQAKWAFEQLQTLSEGLSYAIGDWAIICEERFGKEWVNEILEQSVFSFDQLSASVSVARKIPPQKRVPSLSFDHHVIAARHDQPELALDWAKTLGLTPMQLAVAVRTNKPLSKEEIAATKSVNTWVTPLSVVDKFLSWRKNVPIESWSSEEKKKVKEYFEPILAFLKSLDS